VFLCTGVVVVIVLNAVALSTANSRCHICPHLFALSPASFRPLSPWPTPLYRAAVASPFAAATGHVIYHVCHHLGRLVVRTIVDSTNHYAQHDILVICQDNIGVMYRVGGKVYQNA